MTKTASLRAEIRVREDWLVEVDRELQDLGAGALSPPPTGPQGLGRAQAPGLHDLLSLDSHGACREIQKHTEDLRIAPAPEMGERVVRIAGRGKVDGLLEDPEAVRLQLVAAARFGLWKRPELGFDFLLGY